MKSLSQHLKESLTETKKEVKPSEKNLIDMATTSSEDNKEEES